MKKLLLVLPLFILGVSASAQVVSSCQSTYVDTLKYVDQIKTSNWSGIPANVTNDGGAYGYAGYGQRFEAPDSVKVLGFSFRGFVFSGAADTVVCRLYKADGSGFPDVQVDSVIHTVPLVAGFTSPLDADTIINTVMFGSGHVLEGDYIVTVENFSTSDMYLVRNTDGDGAGEDLCLTYYKGLSDPTFDGWYSTFAFGAGWNFDMPFEPIIEYTFSSELSFSSDTVCQNDSVMVVDTIVSFDDEIMYNRMYNPNYASYLGYTISDSPVYDYGNGNSNSNGAEAYPVSGNYTITGIDTLFSSFWTASSAVVSCSGVVNVYGVELGADTNICMQSTMVLYPGEFDSYSWNTGQMTDSINIGPVLNPGVITYTVDVTSSTCNSSGAISITFDNCTGVDEAVSAEFDVYPNPVNADLTIETNFSKEFQLIIYDYQGKVVVSQMMSGAQQKLDVSGLEEGVYVISLSDEKQVVRKKLQILR